MNILTGSEQCGKSELDLFSIPPTQIAVEDGEYHHIYPSISSETGTLIFKITGDSVHYLDLSQTELWTHLVLKDGEKVLAATDIKNTDIGVINNLAHSIFSQIQVHIGTDEVENSNSTYPYRAYLENLLCFNKEMKRTALTSELYVKDEGDKMSELSNKGSVARLQTFIDKSNRVQVKVKLHSDIFNINRYMLNQTNLQITLTRSKPEFYMINNSTTNKTYRIDIDTSECYLRVRKVKINSALMLEHAMELEKQTAKYPIKQVKVVTHTLQYNADSMLISNVVTGLLPNRLIVGLVETTAYAGSYTKNPFEFKHFNLSSIKLKNGSSGVPYAEGLKLDFDKKNILQGYNTLYQGISELDKDITQEDYLNGYTLYAFNLAPDLCNDEHFSIYKDGALDLELNFKGVKTNGAKSITAIVYCEYDKLLELNKFRRAVVNK